MTVPPDSSDSFPATPPPLPPLASEMNEPSPGVAPGTVPPIAPTPPPLPVQIPWKTPPVAAHQLYRVHWGWAALAVILTFLATNFLWITGLVSWHWWQDRERAPFHISLTHPPEAAFGEIIEMEVKIQNARKHAQTLDSIDIYHSFLRGFEIMSIEPGSEQTRDIADFRTFGFGTELQPEETMQVRFILRARRAGDFIGAVDVCNPEQRYTSAIAQLRVHRPVRNR